MIRVNTKRLETDTKYIAKVLKGMERKVSTKIVRQSLRKGSLTIVQTAKEKVPVKSGVLKSSIRAYKVKAWKPNTMVYRVGLTEKGWYGRFVEFGTIKQKPQPFLRPAMMENDDRVLNTFKSEIRKYISKMGVRK